MDLQKTLVFIDGRNFYETCKALEFEVDFKKLQLELASVGNVFRILFYTLFEMEEPSESRIIPLLDWLSYNGYSVVARKARTDSDRMRSRSRMDVALAVDAMELSQSAEHIVLVTGNGDFVPLAECLQRHGKRVTVLSSITTAQPACSDALRRQADAFLELSEWAPRIRR